MMLDLTHWCVKHQPKTPRDVPKWEYVVGVAIMLAVSFMFWKAFFAGCLDNEYYTPPVGVEMPAGRVQ